MRGMCEDENAQRKANHMRMICEENKKMARDKRAREQAARDNDEGMNQAETKLTLHPEELQMDGTIKRNMFAD